MSPQPDRREPPPLLGSERHLSGVDARVRGLCDEGDVIWDRYRTCDERFQLNNFIPADYQALYLELRKLAGCIDTFLEWGSGTGVVTIMADMLGFEAYGFEIEPRLVEEARQLALRHGSGATFAEGTFVPEDYVWSQEHGDGEFRTVGWGTPCYSTVDMELRDFDLIYAYPWPDEEPMFHDIMRQCGRPGSLFMTYSDHEGIDLSRPPERIY